MAAINRQLEQKIFSLFKSYGFGVVTEAQISKNNKELVQLFSPINKKYRGQYGRLTPDLACFVVDLTDTPLPYSTLNKTDSYDPFLIHHTFLVEIYEGTKVRDKLLGAVKDYAR